jgi:hypothetical protein
MILSRDPQATSAQAALGVYQRQQGWLFPHRAWIVSLSCPHIKRAETARKKGDCEIMTHRTLIFVIIEAITSWIAAALTRQVKFLSCSPSM